MSNLFNSVLMKKPRSNAFNLSYDKKISAQFGYLYPVHVQECIPGDIFKGKTQIMMRFAPMLAPIMHQVDCYIHYFFVPNRILWPNWEKWITGDLDVEPPFVALDDTTAANGTLADHLGLPSSDQLAVSYDADWTGDRSDRKFNAFPFAAYHRIWLEYYRDKNLSFSGFERDDQMLTDGYNAKVLASVKDWTGMRRRSYVKDYFTSALPWAQKGDSMLVPIGFDKDVPVYTQDNSPWTWDYTTIQKIDGTTAPAGSLTMTGSDDLMRDSAGSWVAIDAESSGFLARTSALEAGSTTIQDLRTAFRLQEWLEKNARGGTRYVESILSHFGIRVRDYRLDRPEMIGGGKTRVQISEVLQTAEPPDPMTQTPLGTMAGHGITAGYAGTYNYRIEEHGFIMGIMSVRPTPAYQQGVPRHFSSRQDRLDYYWPTFAHLGEQAIIGSELYYEGGMATKDGNVSTFGYTPRYSEYRRNYSTVAGDFNTDLDFWHMARIWNVRPTLTSGFVGVGTSSYDPNIDRIFALQDDTDYLYAHIFHDIKAIRPMPRYATPVI